MDCLGIPVFRRCLMPFAFWGIKQRRNTGMPKQSKPPQEHVACVQFAIRVVKTTEHCVSKSDLKELAMKNMERAKKAKKDRDRNVKYIARTVAKATAGTKGTGSKGAPGTHRKCKGQGTGRKGKSGGTGKDTGGGGGGGGRKAAAAGRGKGRLNQVPDDPQTAAPRPLK